MIDTVIFDMDGLLLDTEPLWGTSMMHIAQKHGIKVTYEQLRETTGLRIHEVTDHWAHYYPWQGAAAHDVAEEILDDIIEASKKNARVMPGVLDTLELLKNNNIKIGLASSSPVRMIDALVTHYNIKDAFDCITSADVVDLGKPHPAVFLHCAQSLGVKAINCLVFEDSVNGMIAAKAARMKCIVIPDQLHFDDPRFALADAKLSTMEDFDMDMLRRL